MPKHIVQAGRGEHPERVIFDHRSQRLRGFSWHGTIISVDKVEKRWTATRHGLLQTFYSLATPAGRFYLAFYIDPVTRAHVWWLSPENAG
ncbi:MAG: hypothetical protein ACM3ZC_09575 [Bacteroidota bacterium]